MGTFRARGGVAGWPERDDTATTSVQFDEVVTDYFREPTFIAGMVVLISRISLGAERPSDRFLRLPRFGSSQGGLLILGWLLRDP